MNETPMTMAGNVCNDPARRVLDTGTVVTDFRLATSTRRFDRATGGWADVDTLFVGVTCWGALGDHVALSLHKGDPVVVQGRLRISEWEREGVKRSSVEVVAAHVGHDLSRGTTAFTAVRRAPAAVADGAGGSAVATDPGAPGEIGERERSAA